jgi:crotonobetainyl-CoA:carnitine CoA-transferase CaiB-like acyl-CoA transferase
MKSLPLSGIRVLDLSRVLAGPICSMMLGDLGANVIKVERPGTGDDTRGWGPPFAPDGQSAYFLSVNRNKLSLEADFADPADQALLRALIADADIVIDNFLPGVLSKYRLDAGALLSELPKLIWCTVSGFGLNNPRPGYDFVVQAESGWMAITGEPEGDPMKVGVAMVDVTTGKDATIGILAALAARERAGATPLPASQRRVDVTLQSSAIAALVNVTQNVLVSGNDAKRWGNAHANLVPYQLFRAADRPFVLAVGTDAQWPLAAKAMGLDDLAADTALATNAGRLARREQVVTRIAEQAINEPAARWIERLSAVGVPCGLVRTVQEALNDAAVDCREASRVGVPPLWNGAIRYLPPSRGEQSVSVREHHWRVFDVVPELE